MLLFAGLSRPLVPHSDVALPRGGCSTDRGRAASMHVASVVHPEEERSGSVLSRGQNETSPCAGTRSKDMLGKGSGCRLGLAAAAGRRRAMTPLGGWMAGNSGGAASAD